MKIVFLHGTSPLPVLGYGGIERILFWHMCELARMGHKVVLIGHPDSKVSQFGIELIPITGDLALWENYVPKDADIIHLSFNQKVKLDIPVITTVHGNGQLGEIFSKNSVFVSKKHAEIHGSNMFVHNAIDFNEYPYIPNENRSWDNFLFLAKASWRVKNLKDIARASRATHKHLHVAGGRWWGLSRYIHNHGIIGGQNKMDIIRNCDALIFAVRWPEPFGIAVIEAMSQGLPVIGSPYGSLPELINKDVGFIAHNYEELTKILSADHSKKFNPDHIRKYVEENFGLKKHAESYLELYKKVIAKEDLNPVEPTLKLSQRAEALLPF
jgi:glycosyltransferase involved in cell wall biosynthesis